jgi:hypothetical protein
MLAHVEHGGVAVYISDNVGEPAHMTYDRAWLIARTLSTDPFANAADMEQTANQWVWWAHAGCTYDAATMDQVNAANRRAYSSFSLC